MTSLLDTRPDGQPFDPLASRWYCETCDKRQPVRLQWLAANEDQHIVCTVCSYVIAQFAAPAASSCAVSSGEPPKPFEDAAAIYARMPRAERKLRELMWLGHDCDGLYGDDGEMSCGRCVRDFLRDDINALIDHYDAKMLERMARNARGSLSERAPECRCTNDASARLGITHQTQCPLYVVPSAPVSVGASDESPLQRGQRLDNAIQRLTTPDRMELKMALVQGEYLRLLADDPRFTATEVSWLIGGRDEIQRLLDKLLAERASHSSEGRETPSDPTCLYCDTGRVGNVRGLNGCDNPACLGHPFITEANREKKAERYSGVPSESGETPDADPLSRVYPPVPDLMAALKASLARTTSGDTGAGT